MFKHVSLLCLGICMQSFAASPVVAIACGYEHNVALRADGSVVAWGSNSNGQVAIANNLTGVAQIAAGGYQSLALKTNNTIVFGGDVITTKPAGLEGSIRTVAASAYADIAIKNDSTVVVWGGEDGTGEMTSKPAGLKGVGISGGFHYFATIKTDRTVVTWGDENHAGTVPVGLTNVTQVACGRYHMLALKSDGTVVAWGTSGTTAQTAVPAGLKAKWVAAGENSSVAVKIDGTVVSWGSGPSASQIPSGLSNVVAVSAGRYHILALKADGSLAAWGQNNAGQCNIPNTIVGVIANPIGQASLSPANLVHVSLNAMRIIDLTGRITAMGTRNSPDLRPRTVRIAQSENDAQPFVIAR